MIQTLQTLFSRFLNWFLIFCAVVFGVVFATANRTLVYVSLDPFHGGESALSIGAPLFLVILASMLSGIVLGGVAVWFSDGRVRRLARKRKRENKQLQRELQEVEKSTLPAAIVTAQNTQPERPEGPAPTARPVVIEHR